MKLSYWILFEFTAVAIILVLAPAANAQAQSDNCAVCHLAVGVENLTKPAQQYKDDIHAAKGFGCNACHGGDPSLMGLEAMDRKKGYIGKPSPAKL